MWCTLSTRWTTWVWLLTIGSLQLYILYFSIYRYIRLKFEVFTGFQARFEDNKWIFSVLNYQLLTIIVFLGILPLWAYSTLFSSSSFFCGRDVFASTKGVYQLVWDEALNIWGRDNQMAISGDENKRVRCCRRKINIAVFFPISNLLHILMAYLMLLPLPFIEAWLYITNDIRKEHMGYNDLEFLGSRSLIVKIKCSIEYFNFMFSLLNFSFQFSKFLWSCNKSFSILLIFTQILVTVHILLNFSLFSIFITFYYKNLAGGYRFISPPLILLIATAGDALLIFSSFSFFQFGFEKCVQCLLKSSWFNSINRHDTIPLTNHYEHSNCQSTTSSSVFYSPRNVAYKKNSSCPTISAAGLFMLGIGLKVPGCYEYMSHLRDSPYLMLYLVQSLILVLSYTMIWFGMCLKSDWIFTLTEKQLAEYSIITYPGRTDSNYYKYLRSHHGNSQISLSMNSNLNDSLQSKQKEKVSGLDFTKPNPLIFQYSNSNLHDTNKHTTGSNDYLQLNNHVNRTGAYRPVHSTSTLNSPMSPTNSKVLYKDFSRTFSPNYKYSAQLYPRSNEYVRSDEFDQITRKLDLSYTIKEEIDDIYNSSNEDVFLDNKQSLKCTDQMKNNLQLKFVTFQMDKNPEIPADLCSSNENLTIVSLPTSDAFLKELDGGITRKIGYRMFDEDNVMKDNISSLYLLENSDATQ